MGSLEKRLGVTIVASLAVAALSVVAHGQMHQGHQSPGHQMSPPDKGTSTAGPPAPIRISMEELHRQGGVPPKWTFLLPPGDAAAGREVFSALECFACHEVKGEDFPRESKTPRGAGPDLTGMGSHHPREYFAESILNPNRVIVLGPDYTGADRLSKMPSYADTMTLQQLVDVVAYLKSLTLGGAGHAGHHSGDSMKHHAPGSMKKMEGK